VPLLVRTWNLFHGNTLPPRREDRLEEMVRLASADAPDVLCLQEVPVWALDRLGAWSGMTSLGEVAERPSLGPLPSTARIGRALTSLHHGLLRSAFAGQANAILLAPALRVLERHRIVLNSRAFRAAQARWLQLPLLARLAWARERRVCHAVRLACPEGRKFLIANLHATSYRPDTRLADAELLRAASFADALAEPSDPCVLAGDFNVRPGRSVTLAELTGPEWGFSEGAPRIDHVLVRGADAGPSATWPAERRTLDGLLLSDHAPVELVIS
jgi:endonuclease/exonuclease/phosphatase family metal-dependent hydrolase